MKRVLQIFAGILLLIVLGCRFHQPLSTSGDPVGVAPSHSSDRISGTILDDSNVPIPNAVVRVKATEKFTTTDSNGRFSIAGLRAGESVLLTAWAKGYYIGGGGEKFSAGSADIKLILKSLAGEDNPDYKWLSAFASQGRNGNCQNCHFDPDLPDAALPFSQWLADSHALSTKNIRFLTMYLGQDVHGNQSPGREYGFDRDYGKIPIKPDSAKAYFGPGYKLDFPQTAGNCAACHAPVAAINSGETDPTRVFGVGGEGIACDFCHKVWGVHLDPATGLPQPNMPGVFSFEFRRPPEGHQFFAGPFDDVAPGDDTYTPIQRQSQFCAPCHFGKFWDTQIYNSFGEWLNSAYNNPETGRTCQDCHMPSGKNDHFVRLDKGGVLRDPQMIFSHRMPGAGDPNLLQNAVTMKANVSIMENRILLEVWITNDQTGHDVPTDSPLRQLILRVDATDRNGQPLMLLKGETIPEWAGVGDPKTGNYAGLPGKGYAKILNELWTEVQPTGSYWNPTRIVSDNRIPAKMTDMTNFDFSKPVDNQAKIKITLFYRRAFKELMDQKGWDIPDILMEEINLNLD